MFIPLTEILYVKRNMLEVTHSWEEQRIFSRQTTKFMAASIGLLNYENEVRYCKLNAAT